MADYTEYEVAYKVNEDACYFDRYATRESALRQAHALAYEGYSSTVTDVATGDIVEEVIVYS